MKISVTLIDDNSDNQLDYAFQFRFEHQGLHSTILINHPFTRSKNEWKELTDAIEDNKKYRLDFSGPDDYGSIRCDGKRVIFEIKLANNNMKITTTVSTELYKPSIVKCFQSLFADESLVPFWK